MKLAVLTVAARRGGGTSITGAGGSGLDADSPQITIGPITVTPPVLLAGPPPGPIGAVLGVPPGPIGAVLGVPPGPIGAVLGVPPLPPPAPAARAFPLITMGPI